MGQEDFDELLKHIPGIADAVNKFESEAVQGEAFKALLDVWKGSESVRSKTGSATRAKQGNKTKAGGEKSKKKSGKKSSSGSGRKTPPVTAVKDLDLRPKGKKSFVDFVAEKSPRNNPERCLICVYYLSHTLGVQEVGANHVYTCFQARKDWRFPADLRNTLSQTASKDNWLDTSDMEAIKVTPQGRNVVEHDLPRVAKK